MPTSSLGLSKLLCAVIGPGPPCRKPCLLQRVLAGWRPASPVGPALGAACGLPPSLHSSAHCGRARVLRVQLSGRVEEHGRNADAVAKGGFVTVVWSRWCFPKRAEILRGGKSVSWAYEPSALALRCLQVIL